MRLFLDDLAALRTLAGRALGVVHVVAGRPEVGVRGLVVAHEVVLAAE